MRYLGLFAVGGSAYVGLELLWRRRSHVSMFAVGGISFLMLGKIRAMHLPAAIKPLAGAAVITGIELGTGLLVNRDHQVWDYRAVPGNFKGQICLPFTLLWIPVSWLGMRIHGVAAKYAFSQTAQSLASPFGWARAANYKT